MYSAAWSARPEPGGMTARRATAVGRGSRDRTGRGSGPGGDDADERARRRRISTVFLAGDGEYAERASGDVHRAATSSGVSGISDTGRARTRPRAGHPAAPAPARCPRRHGWARERRRGSRRRGRHRPRLRATGRVGSIGGRGLVRRLGWWAAPTVGPADQQSEHLIEGRPGLVDRRHRGAAPPRRDHCGRDRLRVLAGTCNRRGPRRRTSSTSRSVRRRCDVDPIGRLDLEQLPAERAPAERLRAIQGDQPPLGDQRDHVALLGRARM